MDTTMRAAAKFLSVHRTDREIDVLNRHIMRKSGITKFHHALYTEEVKIVATVALAVFTAIAIGFAFGFMAGKWW